MRVLRTLGRGLAIAARYGSAFALAVLFGVGGSPLADTAFAQSGEGAGGEEEWKFSVAPYLWAASLDGNATVRGIPSDIDAGFGDILDDTEFGFLAYADASKGRWTFSANLLWLELSTPAGSGPLGVDADLSHTIVDLLAAFEVARDLDVLGGLRIWRVAADFVVPGAGPMGSDLSVDGAQSWVDGFFGARFVREFAPAWTLGLRGDVGGFNVGSSSDLTWSASALLGWEPWRDRMLVAGYRILDVDYDDGLGSSRLEVDIQYRGPIIGLRFGF